MASIVSPIAQPSRPKSVSRPKRWSEEVEEGTVKYIAPCQLQLSWYQMLLQENVSLVIQLRSCFVFVTLQLTDFKSLGTEMFMNIAMSSRKNQ